MGVANDHAARRRRTATDGKKELGISQIPMQIQVIPHEADPHRVREPMGSLELLGDTRGNHRAFRVARLKLSRRGLLLQPDCRRHRSNLIADQRGEDRVLGKISNRMQ